MRAWSEADDEAVRAAITDVATEERRLAGSIEAVHQVIDSFLIEASVLPSPHTGSAVSDGLND